MPSQGNIFMFLLYDYLCCCILIVALLNLKTVTSYIVILAVHVKT